jgi:hypothetical protein
VNKIIEILRGIVFGNSNKLQEKFGRKVQLNAFKFGPSTEGTLTFNEFLS